MAKIFYPSIIAVLMIFCSCQSQADHEARSEKAFFIIDSLVEHKEFFAARAYYETSAVNLLHQHKLLAEIFLNNAFNKPGLSNEKIETYLSDYNHAELSDTLLLRIKTVALDNSIKLYEYKSAKEITGDILEDFSSIMKKEKIKDHKNTLIIWNALKDEPKQEVIINNATAINIIRDKAGLKTLPVTKDNISEQFVFDTGANFSTITESMARLFDLRILEGNFEVNSITGSKIESQIAIAPKLFIGEIEINNAVFLVFPDEALAFNQIDYQINGIIGFPVIEALKEIQITRDGRFIVPLTHSPSPESNLAIDFLTPLLLLEDDRGSGTYTFDTGASNTMLYNTYYKKYLNAAVDSLQEIEYSFGGAGGNTIKKGIYIPFNAQIGNSQIVLDSVIVLKEENNSNNMYLGNIGQDIIGKFEKLTINFEKMFIRLE